MDFTRKERKRRERGRGDKQQKGWRKGNHKPNKGLGGGVAEAFWGGGVAAGKAPGLFTPCLCTA